MNFRFTSEEGARKTDEIVSYLAGPRLWIPQKDYPDFDAWLSKTHAQLKSETKRVLVALDCGSVVGAVVYQKHQALSDTLEVKNITVRPDMQGRYIASFLLRNAELEGSRDFGVTQVQVDAKTTNLSIRSFLLKNGYRSLAVADLYGLGAGEDTVYRKPRFRM